MKHGRFLCGACGALGVVLAGVAQVGCGSSTTTDFGDGGNTSSGGSTSGSSSGTSSSGGASNSGSSGSGSGSTSSSGSSGSGSGSGGSGGSGSGSGTSSSGSTSGGGDAGTCPSAPCGGGNVCCFELATGAAACAPSCGTGDSLACAKPSECGGSTPDCCATLVVNGGMFPTCTTKSLSTQCLASCPTNFQLTCQATDTFHVCETASDCASDTANPNCCPLGAYNFCLSDIVKVAGKLTCL